ncbi:hypothetical protein ZWY2020_004291 [Hordeum vulgare]|nr:hypothetical protein ZWY2020_004291 [Hordeum vulgare]
MDDGFPYARPSVCELSGDIRIRPKQKTMYLVNPSGAGGFDENGEKQLRPYARKDDFLLPAMVEVTVKSVPSPRPPRHRRSTASGGGVLRRVHGQLLPRQHGR